MTAHTSKICVAVALVALAGAVYTPAAGAVPASPSGAASSSTMALPVSVTANLHLQQRASTGGDPIQPHPESEKAIDRLKSPFCPGFMLEVCPSGDAAELRDSLHARAHRGWKADSLVAWALAEYGDEWSALPETSGIDLVAWIVPGVALLAGVGLVFLSLRALRARRAEAGGDGDAPPRLSHDEEEELREALRHLDESG